MKTEHKLSIKAHFKTKNDKKKKTKIVSRGPIRKVYSMFKNYMHVISPKCFNVINMFTVKKLQPSITIIAIIPYSM